MCPLNIVWRCYYFQPKHVHSSRSSVAIVSRRKVPESQPFRAGLNEKNNFGFIHASQERIKTVINKITFYKCEQMSPFVRTKRKKKKSSNIKSLICFATPNKQKQNKKRRKNEVIQKRAATSSLRSTIKLGN